MAFFGQGDIRGGGDSAGDFGGRERSGGHFESA